MLNKEFGKYGGEGHSEKYIYFIDDTLLKLFGIYVEISHCTQLGQLWTVIRELKVTRREIRNDNIFIFETNPRTSVSALAPNIWGKLICSHLA